jgi:hypothetical protein
MKEFNKLSTFEQKEIMNALLFDGLTYPEIEERFGISPTDIAKIVNSRAVRPYKEIYEVDVQKDKETHKKTVMGWIWKGLALGFSLYLFIVFTQSALGGFESQITSDSIAYITQPLAKVVNLTFASSFIVLALSMFFPILAIFINEKVNTTSLKDTFLQAKPESKLNFLGIIVLALCLLVGLVFSAKAQTKTRECIISTAQKEVGTLEKGGNNKGTRIDYYRSICMGKTIKNQSDPWCGYFVGFVYRFCGFVPNVRFMPRARDWFADSKKIVWRKNFQYGVIKRKPQAGDLIGYKFRSGAIGHIEILLEWHEDYFLAIGGNTSASSTVYRDADKLDGVRLKKRKTETAYMIANHIN